MSTPAPTHPHITNYFMGICPRDRRTRPCPRTRAQLPTDPGGQPLLPHPGDTPLPAPWTRDAHAARNAPPGSVGHAQATAMTALGLICPTHGLFLALRSLTATTSTTTCNARCTSARSLTCACSCGGHAHGSAYDHTPSHPPTPEGTPA